MRRCTTWLLWGACMFATSGCYSNHYADNPSPNNFAADAVNNTAVTVAMLPLYAFALPVLAVGELTDAIASPGAHDAGTGTCPLCGDDACDCQGRHDGELPASPGGRSAGRGPGY